MISLFLWQCDNDLLQEGKWLIDELSFYKSFALTTSFLCSLTSCQIDQVYFAHYDLLRALNFASDFKVNGKNTMASRAGSVKFMLGNCTIVLSLEQHLESFLLIVSLLLWQSLYNDITFGIFLNTHLIVIVFIK